LASGAGLFIVLEGIDGCGSTTQAGLLVDALRAHGLMVTATAEPSAGAIGKLIRHALSGKDAAVAFDWATMALLFAADRLHHVQEVIEPALEAAQVVVSDRYDLSSVAYQSATAARSETMVPWIQSLNRFARRPDLTLVFDIDADVAEQRRRARGGPEEIFEKRELQRKLAHLYAEAERLVPGDRIVHVDGALAAAQVQRQVVAALRQLEGLGNLPLPEAD
jgi:dTMP kinase